MQGNSDLDVPERQRAVSLLGNRAVEEAIEEELLDRFPVDLFPFDIRIVGESINHFSPDKDFTVHQDNFSPR